MKRAIVAAAFALVLGACSALVDFSDLTSSSIDAAIDGSPKILDGNTIVDATSATDAHDASTPALDAGSDAPCDLTSAFGAPVPISELNTSSNESAIRLSADELTAYFSSDRDGSYDVYVTTRASTSSPFATPALVANVNSSANDYSPSLTSDALDLWLDSDREGGVGGRDLYATMRATTSDTFAIPTNIAALNTTSDDLRPYTLPTGLVMYFARGNNGVNDLFRTSRSSLGASFAAPVALSELNTSSDESFSITSIDELAIFFESDRSGGDTNGDIWVAHRANAGDPFNAPTFVAELSSSGLDAPTWLSVDECRLYFQSDRSGNLDLYVASHAK